MAMCSLFSPMQDFVDQEGAIATAQAALDALFDPRLLDNAPKRGSLPRRAGLAPRDAGRTGGKISPGRGCARMRRKQKLQLNRRFFLLRGRAEVGKAPAP